VTGDEMTVTEAVRLLEDRGFTGDFHVASDPPGLVCGRCRHRVAAAEAEVIELLRFEGASDPGDEAVVAALRCRQCGHEGTLVAAYGAAADAAEAEVLAALSDGRRRPR
jgi:hypothetical protein